jgi:hypothetical protein
VNILQNQAGPTGPAAAGPATRASDADRDDVASLLNAAFAEGRLTTAEHAQRLHAAYGARTQPELRQLIGDLPASAPQSAPTSAPGMVTGADHGLLCLLLCLCPPAGIAWWLMSRRRPSANPGRPLPLAAGPDDGRPGARDGQHA